MFHEKIKKFIPLIVIFLLILGFTLLGQLALKNWDLMIAMRHFMGYFFIIFGGFKIINWHGFVEAYRMYDILAKRSVIYAYAYPVIEIALGLSYLMNYQPFATNLIALIIMLISSIGVTQKILQKETIVCACLGAVFKIPMTWVTLLEDLLMAGMALIMLTK